MFRALWLASIVSNIGTWMQNVGATWLMAGLNAPPSLVSLVQSANYLPVVLFSIPAGAMADLLDRRKFLIFTQVWMLIIATLLGILTYSGTISTWGLLFLTFLIGTGSALYTPASQAILPELVSLEEIPAAVALGSASFNLARVIGPGLAGLIVALSGPAVNFFINALSFLVVIIVLYQWKRELPVSTLPSEKLVEAIFAGIRYVRHAPTLHAVFIRCLALTIPGSALWALLPVLTRDELHRGPGTYGTLLGCLGAGALTGTLVLPLIRQRISIDGLLKLSCILFSVTTLIAAWSQSVVLVGASLLIGGMGWLCTLASLNAMVQIVVPEWVRARALSAYLLVQYAGLSVGSAIWGGLADFVGTSHALSWAGIILIVGLGLSRYARLDGHKENLNLEPSRHWPMPELTEDIPLEEGPVLVTVEYRIDPARGKEFNTIMHQLKRIRKRDGAIRWSLYKDVEAPGRYVEIFMVNSWAEHLRQHHRVTVSDRDLEDRAHAFDLEGDPKVTHFIASRSG